MKHILRIFFMAWLVPGIAIGQTPEQKPAESVTTAQENELVQNRGEGKDHWWDALPRAQWSRFTPIEQDQDWFEVYEIRPDVFAIYEPNQFEEVISYLLLGTEKALLFDTGLGIGNMRQVVDKLTDLDVLVLNSHTHYDHVGGNHAFETIYGTSTAFTQKHEKGQSSQEIGEFVGPGWIHGEPPEGFDRQNYQSRPFKISHRVKDGHRIELGGVELEILMTPGHAPDSLCLLDRKRGLLFTGDTLYPATLYAGLSGSTFEDYVESARRLAALADAVKIVLPAHNEPTMPPQTLVEMGNAFEAMQQDQLDQLPYVLTDGDREYKFDSFSVLVSDPPPWPLE